STFDYENILSAMRAAGIPAVQSFSAGTYICNYVLYSALASEYAKNKKVGFIHVPDAEEFGGKLPLETIAQALEIAVRNC
ncbi:MAG: pyroglutamyl-peptidase I, partial [Clostridiales bacterium]|nr:pyroglutamyl-peptidase I [Clostridiales bacterium]